MGVHNEEIARIFDEMAELLALQNANPFRVRAYQRAARTIRGHRIELAEMVRRSSAAGEDAEAALDTLPGIGADLAAKSLEIVNTGRCKSLEQLRRQVPHGLVELLHLPGLGPKRVNMLHSMLGVTSREDLERALQTQALAKIRGLGPKLNEKLARELKIRPPEEKRWLRPVAQQFAAPLVAHLRAVPGVQQVIVAGSYRRGRETVGDLDILVGTDDAPTVIRALRQYDEVASWIAAGTTRVTVVLRSGLHVDLRISKPACFGAALHYFTGSKAHNIHVRRLAQERGLKINEYGVFSGSRRIAGKTEDSVFESVGLPWIPTEMREDLGEIELARAGKLPRLIARDSLRGDLHVHTKASDGQEDLEAMARAAEAAGLEYVAVADHSRYLGLVQGLDERRVRQQMETIDRLNEVLDITLLKGIEVDILQDGGLALPDSLLGELDVVVGSIHSHFGLTEQQQTRRVLRAMEHRAFSILGHPTARLIGERRPIALDMGRVVAAAKQRACFLELNGQPDRLDIDDGYCRMAREQGVLVSIASDAHHGTQFINLDYAVIQARRGWLTPQDVLNTKPLPELRRLLRATIT